MFRPLFSLVALLASLLHPSAGGPAPSGTYVLATASGMLRTETRDAVLTWLRRQPGIREAGLGVDGLTIDVWFAGGLEGAILPAVPLGTPLPVHRLELRRLERVARDGLSPRALVLEPFATELNLGPHAGDVDVSALQQAGFQVDQAYDGAVTLQTMTTLHEYNVIDIDTHSGANQYGEGVLATGQPYTDDPALVPFEKEFSIMPVAVAGTSQEYYGILSRYIQYHEGQFPAHAFMLISGCDLLSANLFWSALQAKGVEAEVSWDHHVVPADAQTAAQILLDDMAAGMSVSAAVSAVDADGRGVSFGDGPAAHFGYLGNGALTLREAAGQQSIPAITPTPSPAPTATPVPTAVPTPTAVPLTISALPSVRPGTEQVLEVTGQPNSRADVGVLYPSGAGSVTSVQLNGSGTAAYRYRQAANHVSPHSRTVDVHASDAGETAVATYVLGYAPLDMAVPAHPSVNHPLTVWVHTSQARSIRLVLQTGARVRASWEGKVAGWREVRLGTPGSIGSIVARSASGALLDRVVWPAK